jgi:hypothetical protein
MKYGHTQKVHIKASRQSKAPNIVCPGQGAGVASLEGIQLRKRVRLLAFFCQIPPLPVCTTQRQAACRWVLIRSSDSMQTNAIYVQELTQMDLRKFFAWPAEQKHRSRIIQAILLCFVLYGYRAIRVEMLRLDFPLAFPAFGVRSGVALVALCYWFVLLFLGIRAIWSRQPNGLLVSVLVIGMLFAWFLPEPPMREEINLFFNRNRYDEIVEQGRLHYQAGNMKYLRIVYEKNRDLVSECPLVMSNSVQFTIYSGTFSLAYSYDKKKPEAPDCTGNGDVWKQIDENWYICKRLPD